MTKEKKALWKKWMASLFLAWLLIGGLYNGFVRMVLNPEITEMADIFRAEPFKDIPGETELQLPDGQPLFSRILAKLMYTDQDDAAFVSIVKETFQKDGWNLTKEDAEGEIQLEARKGIYICTLSKAVRNNLYEPEGTKWAILMKKDDWRTNMGL